MYNDTSDGYEWQFRNSQSNDVSTAGNWWGTNNETRIDARASATGLTILLGAT